MACYTAYRTVFEWNIFIVSQMIVRKNLKLLSRLRFKDTNGNKVIESQCEAEAWILLSLNILFWFHMKITFHQLSVLMLHVQLMPHDFLLLTTNAFVLMVWFRLEGFHFSIHIQADARACFNPHFNPLCCKPALMSRLQCGISKKLNNLLYGLVPEVLPLPQRCPGTK